MCSASQGTRAAKPAVNSGGGNGRSSGSGVASQTWTLPSLRWVSGKEPPQGGLNLNHVPASDGVRARNSNPEKEAEELPSGTDEVRSLSVEDMDSDSFVTHTDVHADAMSMSTQCQSVLFLYDYNEVARAG